jgi:hypothetical protein
MLSITRAVARVLRATLRKAGDVRSHAKPTALSFRAHGDGLRIQSRAGPVGVEYRLDGKFPTESFRLPFASLADYEGTAATFVTFAAEPNGSVRAEWTDAGVPQRRSYTSSSDAGPWLEAPATMRQVGDGTILVGLNEAMSAAATSQVRYALTCIQLRGSKGEAVGSDGRQLLIVRGLSLPWTDEVLVPRTRLFEGKTFTDAEMVEMGRTDDHVVVRVGPWTAWLAIEKLGRFPNVDSVIPRESSKTTRIVIAEEDAEFLARIIPRLPGDESEHSPVTVHANGQVAVRAKSGSDPLTELVLNRSVTVGNEVRIVTDRHFLRRAAQLGIRNIRFVDDRTPVVGESDRHTYVWQPLDSKTALAPSDDAVRIASAAPDRQNPVPQPLPRIEPPMNDKTNVVRSDESEAETTDEAACDPIQEAESVRGQLRNLLGRINGLVHALKQQRRQNQLVRSTLASLKQLQDVA